MKHKKEICLVSIITTLELGGAQKVCLALHNGVKESGNESLLIAGGEGILTNQLKSSNSVFILNSFKRNVSITQLYTELKNFIHLVQQLKKIKKNHPHIIVHTHSTKAGLMGRWAAFFAGIKKRVHTVHGYGFNPYQNKLIWFGIYFLELITSLITTHYVCVSSEDVKTGIRLFPKFAQKHSIIRASVDQKSMFIPATVIKEVHQDELFIFGSISCFKKQKNIFDLLRAFEATYHKNNRVRLELIGDGILRPKIEQWINEHNLQEKITLHGWQLVVAPLMHRWHAFVLSSLWEGLPCAVVEARLCKLPVLSYNTGGIKDVISSGENGFLYPQGNWHALAQGMLDLTLQPDLYKKLQQSPDNLEDFDTTQMVNQHITLYKSLFHQSTR
jgi:glycosyltransferase involved in cell wall biosynthesis